MTESESSIILKAEIVHHPECSIFAEALVLAIQALEKQIPMKVLHSYDDIIDKMWCSCPTCYAGLGWGHVDIHKYCMNCGQKLDLGDEE